MLNNNYFLAREAVVLVIAIVMVFIVSAILGLVARNYIIQDAPIFGNVVFEDYESSLIFCAKLAAILVYIIRPLYYLIAWVRSGPDSKKKM